MEYTKNGPFTMLVALKACEPIKRLGNGKESLRFTADGVNERWPQVYPFEFYGDNVMDKFTVFKRGMLVDVTFYIRGREWENKATGKVSVFCSLSVSEIKKHEEQAPAPAPAPYGSTPEEARAILSKPAAGSAASPSCPPDPTGQDYEDLPF